MNKDITTDTIFEGLVFNTEKFLKMPKCKGSWIKGESGCLLTAFFYAFGLKTTKSIPTNTICSVLKFMEVGEHTQYTALTHFDILLSRIGGTVRYTDITSKYDKGEEIKALQLVWQVIEALPNKTAPGDISEVVMPACLTA